MGEALLQIGNFTVNRGDFLLDHISLAVASDEIFSLIGSTGAGKSLLLEGIAGFYEPQGGRVLYRGMPITEIPLYRRNIGYLYQDYSLFPHMTIFSNIAYGLRMQKKKKAEIQQRVSAIINPHCWKCWQKANMTCVFWT